MFFLNILASGLLAGSDQGALAAIAAFAVIGKALDSLVVAASRPVLRWQRAAGEPSHPSRSPEGR